MSLNDFLDDGTIGKQTLLVAILRRIETVLDDMYYSSAFEDLEHCQPFEEIADEIREAMGIPAATTGSRTHSNP